VAGLAGGKRNLSASDAFTVLISFVLASPTREICRRDCSPIGSEELITFLRLDLVKTESRKGPCEKHTKAVKKTCGSQFHPRASHHYCLRCGSEHSTNLSKNVANTDTYDFLAYFCFPRPPNSGQCGAVPQQQILDGDHVEKATDQFFNGEWTKSLFLVKRLFCIIY
jgi:hypothetical protein